jgi:hypothetical protein
MKATKIVLAVTAVLGIIAIFLPYVSGDGMSLSLWDFHKIPDPHGTQGVLNGPNQAYVTIVFFAIPAVMAGIGFATRLARWQAIVAAVFFALAFAVKGVRSGMTSFEGVDTALGGKLLFLAALAGLVVAIVGAVKPEPRTA